MRAVLIALLALALPVAAEAPPIGAVIDCGTLSGSGKVRILIHGSSVGVVRIVCPPEIGMAQRINVWKLGHDLEVVPCGNGTTFSSSRFTPPESRNALQSVRWPGQ